LRHILPPILAPSFVLRPSPSEPYPLSLHDALPISVKGGLKSIIVLWRFPRNGEDVAVFLIQSSCSQSPRADDEPGICPNLLYQRSEEHTSELQSRFDLVCRLLLDKQRF